MQADELQEVIRMAAEAGAKAALTELEKAKKKSAASQKDRRLRNTRLLLKNYRLFAAYAKNAVYQAPLLNEDQESALEILDAMMNRETPQRLFVESIQRSRARTITIVNHIDTMLSIYEVVCERTGNPVEMRRYKTIEMLYIRSDKSSMESVAETLGVETRTVYNDVKAACDVLAPLFFGVDGVGDV